MLTISNLTYKIGPRTIIENGNIAVMDGWRVGVVGLNGAGKSTLFKLISGELHADGGTISMGTRQRLGMVRQDIPETDTPLIDIVLAAHEEMAQLWRDSETETDGNKIAEIYERLGEMDAYSAPSKAAMLLTGLGFKEHQLTEPFSSFSGGWRMADRLWLVKDGACKDFDGDLEDYRKFTIQARRDERKEEKKAKASKTA